MLLFRFARLVVCVVVRRGVRVKRIMRVIRLVRVMCSVGVRRRLQQSCGKAVGAELQRERPVGRRHVAAGNERLEREGDQQNADLPVARVPVGGSREHLRKSETPYPSTPV